MKKPLALILAAALGAASLPALAEGYGNSQTMSIDGKALRVAETSARILANEAGNAPHLVDDITDGQGAQKVPGYKIMIMSRTYSSSAEARPPRQGSPNQNWGDVLHLHRGTKLVIGIPVTDGRMDLNAARLIDMAVVSDADAPAEFNPADKIRPSGKQLVAENTAVTNPRLRITRLSLPDLKTGEASGGGVQLEAEATLDGRRIQTAVNSTFTHFYSVKPRAARAFAADPRFTK